MDSSEDSRVSSSPASFSSETCAWLGGIAILAPVVVGLAAVALSVEPALSCFSECEATSPLAGDAQPLSLLSLASLGFGLSSVFVRDRGPWRVRAVMASMATVATIALLVAFVLAMT